MTINITWTPRERDVVLQTAVYLYKHGRLRMNRPTHNEAWRLAIFVLPVNRRRNFTSASNLGKIYELYMGLLVDERKVDLNAEFKGHRKLEWPEYMVLADNITVDMITRFGATLDTAIHIAAPKKVTPQEQIDFLMKELERTQRQLMDLTHAFETHVHKPGGIPDKGDVLIAGVSPVVESMDKSIRGRFVEVDKSTVVPNTGEALSLVVSSERGPYGRDASPDTDKPKLKLEVVKGREGDGDLVLTAAGQRLHHLYPMHAPSTPSDARFVDDPNGSMPCTLEAVEGDGIGDDKGAMYNPDKGAMYNPDNFSDMDDDAIADKIIGDLYLLGKDIPAEHRPRPPVAITTPERETPPEDKSRPPIAVEPEHDGPILYVYGLPGRLRALLDHYLKARAPDTKVKVIHLDGGGKTPEGDVAMVVVNPWMDSDMPSARIKLIEKKVTKPRHVDSGWASITEGVRATLAEHYQMFLSE